MKGLRRRVVSLFQLYTNTRQQANKLQSIKKNSSWRTLLSLDDARNDFRGEVSPASICKFKKRDLLFFFNKYLTLSTRWGFN